MIVLFIGCCECIQIEEIAKKCKTKNRLKKPVKKATCVVRITLLSVACDMLRRAIELEPQHNGKVRFLKVNGNNETHIEMFPSDAVSRAPLSPYSWIPPIRVIAFYCIFFYVSSAAAASAASSADVHIRSPTPQFIYTHCLASYYQILVQVRQFGSIQYQVLV